MIMFLTAPLINSSASSFTSQSSPFEFIIKLILVTTISYGLGFLFIKYGKSVSNRPSLASTFQLLGIATMIVISVVKSSLALSLGLVGALSIVRFRTPIKEPEELTYLFLCIAFGLAVGADQYLVAILGFLFVSIYLFLRTKSSRSLSKLKEGSFSLFLTMPSDISESEILDKINNFCDYVSLKRISSQDDKTNELFFSIVINDVNSLLELKKNLKSLSNKITYDFIDTSNVIGA